LDDGKVQQEFALSVASMLCGALQNSYLGPAQLPKPFQRPLTVPEQRVVCGQLLLQVALVNVAATAQHVHDEKNGATVVSAAAAGSSLGAQADQQQQMKHKRRSSRSSRRPGQEVMKVQQHHADLLAAAVDNQPTDMQQRSLDFITWSLQDSTLARVVSVLHMVRELLEVRAEYKAPSISSPSLSSYRTRSSSSSIVPQPAGLAALLYGTAAELALLMAAEPALVAACCSLAAAVRRDAARATDDSGSQPTACKKAVTAASAAAQSCSTQDNVVELDQLLLNELLPAALHAFKQGQASDTAASKHSIQQLADELGALLNSHTKNSRSGKFCFHCAEAKLPETVAILSIPQ
jgi:hypothetical protein